MDRTMLASDPVEMGLSAYRNELVGSAWDFLNGGLPTCVVPVAGYMSEYIASWLLQWIDLRQKLVQRIQYWLWHDWSDQSGRKGYDSVILLWSEDLETHSVAGCERHT